MQLDIDKRQEIFENIFKEHLKIETYSRSIESLLSPRLKDRIDYKPYYQRNYVWDYNKATYFIESILLGTEIPPLIFFENNSQIEIIDGRQRFETILRFNNNKFALRPKGLNVLNSLKNLTYDDLAKNHRDILEKFLDAKLRIIEFKLLNRPILDKYLEDRVKKEIFSRYNSGITPLRKSEIENALYDEDNLSTKLKKYLKSNETELFDIYNLFFLISEKNKNSPPIENIMSFIRKNLVLPMTPITYYARGAGRSDLLKKFYEKLSDDNLDNENEIINLFFKKIKFLKIVDTVTKEKKLKSNRLALECFLWALGVLDLEEINLEYNNKLADEIAVYIDNNIVSYTDIDYGFIKEVLTRYRTTAQFLEIKYKIKTNIYISPNENKMVEIKELIKPNDTVSKLQELESLRLNKPDPFRNSIDDIMRSMTKRRFLIRPTYQRKEVINQSKASSIIESILLGISLPSIFIFKRDDGISEVIDGQQRLLTLLGFIGAEYIDENDNLQTSKNHKFSLRKLRILRKLEGEKFENLPDEFKNKIYDFPLYIVEIDQMQNKNFNAIDLFIRLNDKPFPIRENSFEMWNSWADQDIILGIQKIKKEVSDWFYLKQIKSANDRDRMENEELFMSLVFLEYANLTSDNRKTLDIFQKGDRLNGRIGNKAIITNLLLEITENNENKKSQFNIALKNTRSFLKRLKIILLDRDVTNDELNQYLKDELDLIFKANKNPKFYRRTMQDFYFIWYLSNNINYEMTKYNRIQIKHEIKEIFTFIKNIPIDLHENSDGYSHFLKLVNNLKHKYNIDQRKIKLNEAQKHNLIKQQNNLSSITNALIFLGDDIEVDHEIPLALGGKDEINNLKIVHKDENRSKGSKLNS